MKAETFKNEYQFIFISKPYSSFCMHTHIVPGASHRWVCIPGSTYIGMRACKYSQDILILFKCFMMVRIPHDMTCQKIFPVFLIDKYRYLCRYRFIGGVGSCDKNKGMIFHELNDFF